MSIKKFKELFDELKNVRTIELVCAQKLVIEKVFWAILGIAGVAWAFYFVPSNLEVWRTNPSIITRGEIDLSEIKYPAISILTSGTTKYAIAERLGNYIRPDNLPTELRKYRNLLLKCSSTTPNEISSDYKHYKHVIYVCYRKRVKTTESKKACKVRCHNNTLAFIMFGDEERLLSKNAYVHEWE